MKKYITSGILVALIAASTLLAADNNGPRGPRGPRPDGERGERGEGRRPGGGRPGMALLMIFDANKDGTIDATEISNAATALKTLDKNNDGQITADEMRPPRPANDDAAN